MVKEKYNKIVLTNLPAFYKINLFNRISERLRVLVIFTGKDAELRNRDFLRGEMRFDNVDLSGKSTLGKIRKLASLLNNTQYDELIIGGWDELLLWFAAFYSSKRRNAIIVESSVIESKVSGIIGAVKRLFLSRVSKAYASGILQKQLLQKLSYRGEIKITKGVGVFNVIDQAVFERRDKVEDFLYVGRLSPEKNLVSLIECFKKLPLLRLHIVGFGPIEAELHAAASDNVKFHGAVRNAEIYRYYREYDVFILPSKSEAWGLVVEEALNNGMPVIASNRVGCVGEVLIDNYNGLVYDQERNNLYEKIMKITQPDTYNKLRENIANMDFAKTTVDQVNIYTS